MRSRLSLKVLLELEFILFHASFLIHYFLDRATNYQVNHDCLDGQ